MPWNFCSYLLSRQNASIRQRRTWGTYTPEAYRNGRWKKCIWWIETKKPHWNKSMIRLWRTRACDSMPWNFCSYLLSRQNASIRQRRTWGTYTPKAYRNGKWKKCIWWIETKKPHWNKSMRLLINMAATYSPGKTQVPSAMGDLTSLFGMGRGEHPRQNHHKLLRLLNNQ